VPYRPLAIVSALTVGDYVLWNWSLGANHEVVALVCGLTLPPLGIAFVWLAVLSAARLVARSALGARERARRDLQALRSARERTRPAPAELATHEAPGRAAAVSQPGSSDKLAA
jgi:hypothetical protein